MEPSWTLPPTLAEQTRQFFSEPVILKATNLIQKGKVNLSYVRGDFQSSLIVSGLVREDRAHECKIVYKARHEGSHESPLSSNCDCIYWTQEHHCQHAAALFVMLKLKEFEGSELNGPRDDLPAINLNTTMAVSPLSYGTLINSPRELVDAPATCTYSSLRYMLRSKKVVDFPIPENFAGTLCLNIRFDTEILDLEFSYRNDQGETDTEISIFENLYLFNWRRGTVHNLNNELKDFVQKIRLFKNEFDLQDYLRLTQIEALSTCLAVSINGRPLSEATRSTPLPRITLNPSAKQGFIEFNLVFHDENALMLPMPKVLSELSFGGGALDVFKKKKDAYDFLTDLAKSFTEGGELYKRKMLGLKDRHHLIDLMDHLQSSKQSFTYDIDRHVVVEYDHTLLRDLVTSLISKFGELFFRFSTFHRELEELRFLVTQNVLYSGLSEFNQRFTPFGLTVYYDRQELARWNSRIRFERRNSGTRWFDLQLELSTEDLELIKAADLDQGLALTTRGLILLTPEERDLVRFMKRYTQFEGDEGESADEGLRRFTLPFQRARIFELFELKRLGVDGALTKEEEEICERLATLEALPEYELPAELNAELRPYQKVGYSWLRFLYDHRLGACLADDMGLGKTLQTIAFLQSINESINHVLIVCPVTILLNWENEFKKFSTLDVHIYHGGTRELPKDAKIILTSYGVMKKEADTTFSNYEFDVMILDEVQHLKNMRSLGAYSARRIKADFRICLTGTPVENDLAEFYNILDLSLPGIWGDLQFVRTTSTTKSRLIARKTASPFILRRTKGQVLTDLPDKIENTIQLSFTTEEREGYLKTLLNTRNRIQTSPSRNKYGEILKGLLELRQSCLWQKKNAAFGMMPTNILSTKIEFLVDTLDQIIDEGHQTIVFSQFTTYLDLIQDVLARKHWKLSRIDGSQSVKKRQEQVDRFQEGKSQVFLISLKAGGVGLNLTAASYVFIMDPWWNPAVEAQAIDRAHRIGQKNTLTVYRPIMKDSVEEKVLVLQEQKKKLFYDLLPENDDQYFAGKLSMQDFESLISVPGTFLDKSTN
jgi:superfamily II DNA or RNA helicase